MRVPTRIAVVLAGYAAAAAVAGAVVACYIAATSGPDRDTYAVMYDFGDLLLGLAVFALAAIPATAAALWFLRPVRAFWIALASFGVLVSASGAAAFADCAAQRILGAPLWSPGASALATLRVILAPVFALFDTLAGALAPGRAARIVLLSAAAIDAAGFLYWLLGLRA